MSKKRAVLHWSGGKDCVYALHLLNQQKDIEVDHLFVSLNVEDDRVSAHDVKKVLIEKQAESVGLPVTYMSLPETPSNREYEEALLVAMERCKNDSLEYAVFGDIFLNDLREYRERLFKNSGLKTLFPLWGINTRKLAKEFINSGFKAKVVSVNGSKLDETFAGREYNESFLKDLPAGVDPCGENGEFHTFVYDGPIFLKPVSVKSTGTAKKLLPSPDKSSDNIQFFNSELSVLE